MAAIRVLVVEDDPAFVRLVEAALESATIDFKVETADSLANAAHALSTMPFNVILLDLGLPDSHGVETVTSIHSICDTVPIVVITGEDDDKIAMQSIAKGANAFFRKSKLSVATLFEAMQHAVTQHRIDAGSSGTSAVNIKRVVRRVRANLDSMRSAITRLDECDLEAVARDAVSVLRLNTSELSDQIDKLEDQ